MEEKKRRVGRPPKQDTDVRDNKIVIRLSDIAYRRLNLEADIKKCIPTDLAAEMLTKAIDKIWPDYEDEAKRIFESLFEKQL